ncbi:MAG TPA: GNAT family N-acetyltransferase [Mycobacteriales bacterium]|nr:GNAT family N-acetyltransferase [Mycobacteriales bacterium]
MSGPGDYPPHWEADVLLSDGGTLHLRPIRPDDADQMLALHGRMSDRTRYLRFFGPYPVVPERDLQRFTHVDHVNRVALVAQLGGDLIAVGRYERDTAPPANGRTAEVAFVVQDDQQGRGIGSVLLEHLAAAARERGISQFTAEVLTDNPGMVRVFLDAGYQVVRHYDGGVVSLSFPIEPTETSRAVAHERERRAEARSVERLLTPGSVAVIGASSDPGKVGHAVFLNLLNYRPHGPVYPVNPTVRHVAGVRAYPTVLDVPDDIDLAVVAVPAWAVSGVVEQCADKGVRALVVVSGGFGERGDAGRLAENELVAAARGNGMRVVGPNCLGVINTDPAVRLNATLAPLTPDRLGRGPVGFFCQSGVLGVAILEEAATRGLGLTTFVSAGNRADVSGNDLLQYWADDADTEVVLLYLESFGNPRKFARLARRLARRKPVVAVKSTLRAGVAPGLASHTVDVPDESVRAVFASCGLIRVHDVSQLFDVGQLLAYQPLPAGRRTAIVANSSALGVLTADACIGSGLTVVAGSPVDVEPGVTPAEFGRALAGAVGDPDTDMLVAVFAPPVPTGTEEFARVLTDVAAEAGKPVVTTFLGIEGFPAALRRIGPDGVAVRGSVPSYPSPERAAFALACAASHAQWRRRSAGRFPELPGADPAAARALVAEILATAPDGRELDGTETGRLLTAFGVEVWPVRAAATADEAVAAAGELGYPVACKSTVPALRHREDLRGVRLDLDDEAHVRAAFAQLSARNDRPVLVQRMAARGVATAVVAADDPSFGALVSFGIGGIASELLGDRAYAAAPLSDSDAADLVRAPRAAPLLFGHRGTTPADTGAVELLLVRVSRLVDMLPDVLRVELNPVLVAPRGLAVLGARVRVGPPSARADPGPRRLP